jgi:hypothetical protein
MQLGMIAAFFDILDTEDQIQDTGIEAPIFKGDIRFEKVRLDIFQMKR